MITKYLPPQSACNWFGRASSIFFASHAYLGLEVAYLAVAADHKIIQKEMAFHPNELSIKVGDNIHFINADIGTHNAYVSSDTFQFDLQAQQPGNSKSVTFTRPGVFEVRCAMHPRMKLKVTVTP
jgi:plastocyanin